MQTDPQRAGVDYDKEFIVCSLDLLSGLAEGLGTSIESLVIFQPALAHKRIHPAMLFIHFLIATIIFPD